LDRGEFVWPSAAGGAVSISAAQMAYMMLIATRFRMTLPP
jgi:hypothetical protein